MMATGRRESEFRSERRDEAAELVIIEGHIGLDYGWCPRAVKPAGLKGSDTVCHRRAGHDVARTVSTVHVHDVKDDTVRQKEMVDMDRFIE